SNRVLGLLLAFNAGAVNAGGFLVVHIYTSHLTGVVSQLADNLVLGNSAGTGSTGRVAGLCLRRGHHGCWSTGRATASCATLRPLLLEAALMLVFGLLGAVTLSWSTPFTVPLTVLLWPSSWGCKTRPSPKCPQPRFALPT
ncbi:DUF1275 domain-containing protein, partial [Staphylococcus epidermidis]|nr:DUF1275 domain-containing protein [Staphylococcus epidermidis]